MFKTTILILMFAFSIKSYGGTISNEYKNEIVSAINKNNYIAVKKYLSLGANPNQLLPNEGRPIIFIAVLRNNPDIIEALVNAGADVDYKLPKSTMTPLANAICTFRSGAAALKLIELGADVNIKPQKCNMLLVAIANAIDKIQAPIYSEIVEKLIDNGININYYSGNRTRFSTLSIAVMKKSFYYVKLLIKAGANPNLSGRMPKSSPLYLSIYSDDKRLDIFNYLLKNGANPSIEEKPGELIIRASRFNKNAIPILLRAGASKL